MAGNSNDVLSYDIPAESDFGYAQAIRSGELIHVSGQVAFDEVGEFPHSGDFAAQLERTRADMDRVLDRYGATRDQIVSRTVYMVGVRRNAAAASEGDLKYFGVHRPAATVLGVTEPAVPGQVVEIAFAVDLRLPA